jgi:outer membrane protein OmpA-like peptidoglycan-associated protein
MKHLITGLLIWGTTSAIAQQDLTLYNMRYLQQASFTNASFTPECKVNIGLLTSGIYGKISNSGFVYRDFINKGAKDSLYLTPVKALGEMKGLNYLEQEFRYDLLQFGFRVKQRNYFALNVSVREQFQLSYPRDLFTLAVVGNGITPPEAAEDPYLGNSEYGLLGERANLDGIGIDMNVYTEIGVQYARKFMDKEQLSIGIRPKLLFGAMNIYTRNSEFGLYTDPTDYSLVYDGNLVINRNLPLNSKDSTLDLTPASFFKNVGFGLDLGATYNFTPKLQISASANDIGFITWKSNPETYYLVGSDTFRGIEGIEGEILGAGSAAGTDTTITQKIREGITDGFSDSTDTDKYKTWLTAHYNLGFNYQFAERSNLGVLLNAHTIHRKLRAAMTISYNYRMRKWIGFSANYSIYNGSFANVGVGLSLNLFPFQGYLIFDNVLAPIIPQNTKNLHFRAGVNLNFGCKEDRDKDGIEDKRDKCPTVPGLPRFEGCPDTDGDGIQDSNDSCVTLYGPKETQGCPDRDQDGIMDSEDDCPDTKGLVEFKGCPDTDKDGIMDKLDSCAQDSGLAQFNGCPDKDEDGIMDKEDACPDKFGPAKFEGCPDTDGDGLPDNTDGCPMKKGPLENNGCPYGDKDGDGVIDIEDACIDIPGPVENKGCPLADLDGDGVLDKDDACIDTPGPVENNGCPFSDLDGDGVLDKDDRCPQTPGPVTNQGCPEIQKEEQEVLNTAFSNLEFETGKEVIKASSFESLDKLAELLIKKQDWRIQISGHTDDVGNDAANMALSEKRSKSVGTYLESKGVARDKMIIQWFGETKPVADNSTPEGRKQNRRVEMEVVFE